MSEATATTTTHADLNDLWSDERCAWHVENHDGEWVVILEWTQEYGNLHGADWTTFTWQFYGDTVDEALAQAVEWCWALVPWRRCAACDGNGEWGGHTCDECAGSGLAA